MKVSTALTKTLALIEKGRCQGTWAEDKDGNRIEDDEPWLSRKAVKLCLSAAVYRAYRIREGSCEIERAAPAVSLLQKVLKLDPDDDDDTLAGWNDDHTDKQAIAAVKKAIAVATRDGM